MTTIIYIISTILGFTTVTENVTHKNTVILIGFIFALLLDLGTIFLYNLIIN